MGLSLNDLKKGVVFRLDGQLYVSLGGQQKVAGRQRSVVTVRARQIPEGRVVNHAFRGNEAVELVSTAKKTVGFLYRDGRHCYFMDPDSYDQYSLDQGLVGPLIDYLTEGQRAVLILVDDQPVDLELPKNVELEVVEATPAVRGDTTTAILKDVKLNTGLTIKVPGFIKPGDAISVDTETGNYRERLK